jgi:hypothetical protein
MRDLVDYIARIANKIVPANALRTKCRKVLNT